MVIKIFGLQQMFTKMNNFPVCLGEKNVGKKIDREGKNLKPSCYFRLTVYRLEEDLN